MDLAHSFIHFQRGHHKHLANIDKMKKETEDRIKYIDNARTQVLIEYNGKKDTEKDTTMKNIALRQEQAKINKEKEIKEVHKRALSYDADENIMTEKK